MRSHNVLLLVLALDVVKVFEGVTQADGHRRADQALKQVLAVLGLVAQCLIDVLVRDLHHYILRNQALNIELEPPLDHRLGGLQRVLGVRLTLLENLCFRGDVFVPGAVVCAINHAIIVNLVVHDRGSLPLGFRWTKRRGKQPLALHI